MNQKSDENNYIIYGRNLVQEALKSERQIDTIYIDSSDESKAVNYYVALAKEKGAVVKRVPAEKLEELCLNRNHQGLVAIASVIEYADVDDILQYARQRGEDPFILMLDGIEDPHNLGAIIRTAEAAGVHGVIIPKRGGAQITQTVDRVSVGAVNHLKIARVTNLANEVRTLKKAGIFCYTADKTGFDAFKTNLTGPILLVIGSEGEGVSHLLTQLSDSKVSIPMFGKVTSLNASVAAGVLVYEIVRQRMND